MPDPSWASIPDNTMGEGPFDGYVEHQTAIDMTVNMVFSNGAVPLTAPARTPGSYTTLIALGALVMIPPPGGNGQFTQQWQVTVVGVPETRPADPDGIGLNIVSGDVFSAIPDPEDVLVILDDQGNQLGQVPQERPAYEGAPLDYIDVIRADQLSQTSLLTLRYRLDIPAGESAMFFVQGTTRLLMRPDSSVARLNTLNRVRLINAQSNEQPFTFYEGGGVTPVATLDYLAPSPTLYESPAVTSAGMPVEGRASDWHDQTMVHIASDAGVLMTDLAPTPAPNVRYNFINLTATNGMAFALLDSNDAVLTERSGSGWSQPVAASTAHDLGGEALRWICYTQGSSQQFHPLLLGETPGSSYLVIVTDGSDGFPEFVVYRENGTTYTD